MGTERGFCAGGAKFRANGILLFRNGWTGLDWAGLGWLGSRLMQWVQWLGGGRIWVWVIDIMNWKAKG